MLNSHIIRERSAWIFNVFKIIRLHKRRKPPGWLLLLLLLINKRTRVSVRSPSPCLRINKSKESEISKQIIPKYSCQQQEKSGTLVLVTSLPLEIAGCSLIRLDCRVMIQPEVKVPTSVTKYSKRPIKLLSYAIILFWFLCCEINCCSTLLTSCLLDCFEKQTVFVTHLRKCLNDFSLQKASKYFF